MALTGLRKYMTVAYGKKFTERNLLTGSVQNVVLDSYFVLEKIKKASVVYTETQLSVKENLFILL